MWSDGDRTWLLAVTRPQVMTFSSQATELTYESVKLQLRRWSPCPRAPRLALHSTLHERCQGEKSSDCRFFHACNIHGTVTVSKPPERTRQGSEELRRWSVGSRHMSLSQARLNPHRRSEQTQMYRELEGKCCVYFPCQT